MAQTATGLSNKTKDLTRIQKKEQRVGVAFPRYFTAGLEAGKTPYDVINWETRTAAIGNDKGSVIFEQRDIETPVDWSQTAREIHNQVRAWHLAFDGGPVPGPIAELDGKRVKLMRTSLADPGDGSRAVDVGDGKIWILESEPQS